MKTIPFDLETAKRITEGKEAGKIITSCGCSVRIICFDKFSSDRKQSIVALIRECVEKVMVFNNEGKFIMNKGYHLVIKKEDEFNPFDRVLVRTDNNCSWQCGIYSHKHGNQHVVNGELYPFCIPYEGNEHLVGTTKSPYHETV